MQEQRKNHTVIIDNREKISADGVLNIEKLLASAKLVQQLFVDSRLTCAKASSDADMGGGGAGRGPVTRIEPCTCCSRIPCGP